MSRTPRERELSNFGQAVEAWREKHQLSQAVVADLIGTHQRTLSGWLKADGMPGAVYQIARLAQLMGESALDLLAEDADLAPLRDPAYLQRVLMRVASKRVLEHYLANGVQPEATPEDEPPDDELRDDELRDDELRDDELRDDGLRDDVDLRSTTNEESAR
jgi:transcriptional regulator with XRE-family HTH domain